MGVVRSRDVQLAKTWVWLAIKCEEPRITSWQIAKMQLQSSKKSNMQSKFCRKKTKINNTIKMNILRWHKIILDEGF